ncbi:MAG: YbjN domain-containing protein [Clostridiales Family XIII bacterium]|nr:YbjN domain-containing protein [Clostridiales Family XIII bacterium]
MDNFGEAPDFDTGLFVEGEIMKGTDMFTALQEQLKDGGLVFRAYDDELCVEFKIAGGALTTYYVVTAVPDENALVLVSQLPFTVPLDSKEAKDNVLEVITAINDMLDFGEFVFSPGKGALYYTQRLKCPGGRAEKKDVELFLHSSIAVASGFCTKLFLLSQGLADVQDVLRAPENVV